MTLSGGLERLRALTSPRTFLALVLLLIASSITLIIFLFALRSPEYRANRALVRAFSKKRMTEARISGGFQPGSYDKSDTGLEGVDLNQLSLASELLSESGESEDSPDWQLLRGRFQLAQGRSAESLNPLQAAIKFRPTSPEAHNDLGVCLFERGKIEEAFEEFDTALRYDTQMTEALFNRALCYRRLLLLEEAESDIGTFLDIEGDDLWLKEGNNQLEEIRTSLNVFEDRGGLLSQYNDALDRGDEAAARKLFENNDNLLYDALRVHLISYLLAASNGNSKEAALFLYRIELAARWEIEIEENYGISDLAKYLRSLPSGQHGEELTLIYHYYELSETLNSQNVKEYEPLLR